MLIIIPTGNALYGAASTLRCALLLFLFKRAFIGVYIVSYGRL
jgi:hypothetical protein